MDMTFEVNFQLGGKEAIDEKNQLVGVMTWLENADEVKMAVFQRAGGWW
jgi:hypothetical protein